MTLFDVLRSMQRWWYVVLITVTLTGGIGLAAIRTDGVYFSRMEVVFLVPPSWSHNILERSPEGLMVAASAVTKRITGAGEPMKYGSTAVTLPGISDSREETWIRVEDLGSQWATDIHSPIILVDIVAMSPERIRELQYDTIEAIRAELTALETGWKVADSELIVLEVTPETTVIHHIGGNRMRALGMTTALGGVTILVVLWVLERRWPLSGDASRGSRQAAPDRQPGDGPIAAAPRHAADPSP